MGWSDNVYRYDVLIVIFVKDGFDILSCYLYSNEYSTNIIMRNYAVILWVYPFFQVKTLHCNWDMMKQLLTWQVGWAQRKWYMGGMSIK